MLRFKSLPMLAGAVALGAFAFGGPAAHADFVAPSFDLTIANANLATQSSGPYASVTITGVGGGMNSSDTFSEFEVTANGLNNFEFGDSSVFDLNLNTTDTGAGTLCTATSPNPPCTTGGPTPSDLSLVGSKNVDSFGTFNFVLNDGAGFSHPLSSLTFDFTTVNAVTVADLLTSNGTASVAAHEGINGCTGFTGNGGTQGTGPGDQTCMAVPAPVIGHGVLVLLAVGGVLAGGRALESYKKYRLQAA